MKEGMGIQVWTIWSVTPHRRFISSDVMSHLSLSATNSSSHARFQDFARSAVLVMINMALIVHSFFIQSLNSFIHSFMDTLIVIFRFCLHTTRPTTAATTTATSPRSSASLLIRFRLCNCPLSNIVSTGPFP